MKRVGFLYERIAEPDNLRAAYIKAVRGKQGRKEVIRFRADFEQNIARISRQLLAGEYDIGHYRFFHVRDPKHRLICAASFPERVLHHAIMNICEPVFERYAIHDSYACRVGKGVRKAVSRCREFARRDCWYLKIDIHKYFDSIDHRIVLDLLARRFKDRRLLRLFADLLATYHVTPGKGVPIGNLISQHLANFYLGLFDHWIKEEQRVKGYLRYMDDFVLFTSDKGRLKDLFAETVDFLAERLALRVKSDWQLNRCATGIPYLGFHVFPHRVNLGKRSRNRFREKFRQYMVKYEQGVWGDDDLARHLAPLVEFTKTADAFVFRQNVLKGRGVLSS